MTAQEKATLLNGLGDIATVADYAIRGKNLEVSPSGKALKAISKGAHGLINYLAAVAIAAPDEIEVIDTRSNLVPVVDEEADVTPVMTKPRRRAK